MSNKMTVRDVDFRGKRVVMRCEFNCPVRKGRVSDPLRVIQTIPTIKYILEKGAQQIVLLTHMGRPKGRRLLKYTVYPVKAILEKELGISIRFIDECVGAKVEAICSNLPQGSVVLCENVRFHAEEEGKGTHADGSKFKPSKEAVKAFRRSLSSLGDIYVNDAFGAAHRAHSSVIGIDCPLKVGGLLMEKELQNFGRMLADPPRPFLAILGGAKVRSKLPLIMNLLDKVDEMIISGGMAYTFLKVMDNMPIGNSLFDDEGAKLVPKIIAKAEKNGVKLHFPKDFKIGTKFDRDANVYKADVKSGIADGWMGLDVGPVTRVQDAKVIWRAKSILFNGTPGAFELPSFAYGTMCALHAVAAATSLNNALTIVGGGDTAAAARRYAIAGEISHISTGGGASLELMEGKELPGIMALSDKTPTDPTSKL